MMSILGLALVALALLWVLSCLVWVTDGTVVVVERLNITRGATSSFCRAGLSLKAPWPFDRVVGLVPVGAMRGGGDLALRTLDGAPVRISVEARLHIPVREAARALSTLDDPCEGVDVLVLEHLSRRLSEFTLSELVGGRGRLALELAIDLGDELKGYGFRIDEVIVGEPRTTVDVWRMRDDRVQAMPSLVQPTAYPQAHVQDQASLPSADDTPNECADGAEDGVEHEFASLMASLRAANPGMSQEAILGIVYQILNDERNSRVTHGAGCNKKHTYSEPPIL
ncbi:SPFH domain-containing protein [Pseudomonadota bacterium]